MQGDAEATLKPETRHALSALDAMWAAVDALRPQVLTERPANGFTQAEYASRYGVAATTAHGHITSMVQRGQLVAHVCLLPDARGRMTPTNVYVPCQPSPSAH